MYLSKYNNIKHYNFKFIEINATVKTEGLKKENKGSRFSFSFDLWCYNATM